MLHIIGAIFVAVATTVLVDRSKKWIDRLEDKYFGEADKKEDK